MISTHHVGAGNLTLEEQPVFLNTELSLGLCFAFETGSHTVGQAGSVVQVSLKFTSRLRSAECTGMFSHRRVLSLKVNKATSTFQKKTSVTSVEGFDRRISSLNTQYHPRSHSQDTQP